jgi:carbon-monoxide dehydrogenase large subunit
MRLATRTTRREDARLLTGLGRYAADFHADAELHACFVRSDRAHARIVSIDTAAAREQSGVLAVYIGADMAELRWPPTYARLSGRGGKHVLEPKRWVIATDRVRFVGEVVAMIVAESPMIAQDAAELIAVEYEELPVVVEAAAALAAGAPLLHDRIPANICFEYEFGDAVQAASIFSAAPAANLLVTRLAVRSQRLVSNPMEPRACIGQYGEGNGYTLRVPTQGVAMMRSGICAMMDVPAGQVHILAEDVGGGFGTRSNAEPEYGAVLLAARRLGRPVRWAGTRSEGFLSDSQGRANDYDGELALDRAGRFLALRFRILSNLGAYLTQTGALVHSTMPAYCANGVYDIHSVHGLCTQVLTNTAPVGAYRGAGRPDIAYFIERIVDRAAADHGFDRIELRRRNLVPREAFPYRNATGYTYDSGDFGALLDRGLALSDWPGFPARAAAAAARGRLRGIGLAMAIEPSGGGLGAREEAAIRFNPDRTVAIYSLSQSNGQGHETTFPMLVGELLGIAPAKIQLRASEADSMLTGFGSVGSRSLMLVGSAFKLAAQQAIAKARVLAAHKLGVPGQVLEFRDGAFVAPGGEPLQLLDLGAMRAGDGSGVLDVTAGVPMTRAFPNGCHIAEVEIDPDTGEVQIDTYTAVDDFGNVINHAVVEGQVHGGVTQGAGQVLGEHCVYDPQTGQLLTGSFMDYTLPRAGGMPEFRIADHPVPCTTNALGAKGAGEAGTTGALAAIMNGVIDALRVRGISEIDMPVTPARVWEALRGQPR